ncbi:MAG TPA: hypothetical protein VEA99_09855 [Gemmatimonadaceae bacterium]|nr:hypothetical protein [Gemmatimonadaceae bacterium]
MRIAFYGRPQHTLDLALVALAAVAAGVPGVRVLWRSEPHHHAGETDRVDAVVVAGDRHNTSTIAADYHARGIPVVVVPDAAATEPDAGAAAALAELLAPVAPLTPTSSAEQPAAPEDTAVIPSADPPADPPAEPPPASTPTSRRAAAKKAATKRAST